MRKLYLLKTMLLLCAIIVGSGSMWAETKSVDISPSQALNDGGVDPITIVCAKGDGTSNPAISSEQLRLYQAASGKTTGNTITFSSEKNITSIVFTFANDMTADNGSFSVGTYDSETSTWSGSTNSVTLTVTGTTSGKRVYITALKVYYDDGDSQSSDLEDSDFALTGSTGLSFDLYTNPDAQVINYTTSSTGVVTVTSSEYISAVVGDGTITVTPLKKTNGEVEITVNQAADETYKAGTATFTVTITDSTPKTGAWEKTDLADLEEGDVFVIVGDNGGTYAMSNGVSSSNPPSAVAVTIASDEITSDVEDNIKWNISGNATDGYTFYPNGDTENWLYCTNSNNGVRVGTNNSKTFVIKDDYLYHNGTSRYVGVYNSQDWRCYTSINSNITGQTFAFYKYVDANAPQKVDPELSFSESEVNINFGEDFTAPTLTTATGFNGTVEYTSSDETVAQVMDSETGDLRIVGGGTTTITASFAGNDTFKKGSANYTLTVTDNRIATTISQENIVINLADVATLTKLTPVVKDAEDNVVEYTNSPEGEGLPEVYFETVDDENGILGSFDSHGNIVLNSVVGTATIKAVFNQFQTVANYQPSECTFTITVNDPNAPGTENNPYTVAQAIVATPTTGEVYISGKVSSFYNTSIVGDGSNYRYYISDDGTTDTQLLVYRGKGLNQEVFSDANDLQVGDEVVIYGKLTMYQNDPEVASGNYLTSWNRPADTTPSITLSTTSVEATAAETEGEIEVTYNNFTLDEADVVFYESDGTTTTTCDWIVASVNASNNLEYIIGANTGAERTAYMKVYALDGDANELYSQLITVTQAKYVAPDVEVEPAVAGVGAFVKVTSTADITAGNYLIVYEGNETHDAVAFNGALETLDAANNGIKVAIVDSKIPATTDLVAATFTLQPSGSLKSASGLYIGKEANSNGLDADEDKLTNTFEIDDDNNAVITAGGGCTLRYNYASDQLRFRYYKSGQQAVTLYKYDNTATPTITVKVTDVKYATFSSEYAVNFSGTSAKVYTAKADDNKVVTLTEIEDGIVPAYTGVVVYNENGAVDLTIPVATSVNTTADWSDNEMVATVTRTLVKKTDGTVYNYIMQAAGEGGIEFNMALEDGAYMPAGRAYLSTSVDASANNARMAVVFNDSETTGINSVERSTVGDNRYYNLNGQRVMTPAKGLYIVNGKKVVLK